MRGPAILLFDRSRDDNLERNLMYVGIELEKAFDPKLNVCKRDN
jgi:hypothetical protein